MEDRVSSSIGFCTELFKRRKNVSCNNLSRSVLWNFIPLTNSSYVRSFISGIIQGSAWMWQSTPITEAVLMPTIRKKLPKARCCTKYCDFLFINALRLHSGQTSVALCFILFILYWYVRCIHWGFLALCWHFTRLCPSGPAFTAYSNALNTVETIVAKRQFRFARFF